MAELDTGGSCFMEEHISAGAVDEAEDDEADDEDDDDEDEDDDERGDGAGHNIGGIGVHGERLPFADPLVEPGNNGVSVAPEDSEDMPSELVGCIGKAGASEPFRPHNGLDIELLV